VQTCYAKWLSIFSGYCEFNALVYVHCVEWNCHYFFYLSYSCLFLCCLLVLPYYMVNKDEYIIRKKNFVKFVKFGFSVYGRRL